MLLKRGLGNGEWEMGNGNGKSKIAEIVVNVELNFFSGYYHILGNVLRQNKGNLPMISRKRERCPSFLVISVPDLVFSVRASITNNRDEIAIL